jgi:hypothetical protein
MVKIYGIVYDDKTTEYEPFRNDNPENPWRFENNPMCYISDHLLNDLKPTDIVGVLSWKFGTKARIDKSSLLELMSKAPSADVYSFSRELMLKVPFMDWSDEGHVGIKSMIRKCCQHIGLKYNNDPQHVIYANQFLATKRVYQLYINEVIKPCLKLLEGPMWEEVNRDPGYTRAVPGVKYTYIPFILERMMMQYIDHYKLKCLQMI